MIFELIIKIYDLLSYFVFQILEIQPIINQLILYKFLPTTSYDRIREFDLFQIVCLNVIFVLKITGRGRNSTTAMINKKFVYNFTIAFDTHKSSSNLCVRVTNKQICFRMYNICKDFTFI